MGAQVIAKVTGLAIIKLPIALVGGLFTLTVGIAKFLALHTWDFGLFLGNILTPKRSKGHVYKPGQPGHEGIWPEFVAPEKGDSRSPCPGLNAMANHGILPHDGRNISMKLLEKTLVETWNFSPTFCRDSLNAIEKLYGRDHIDLGDLSGHNIIEHDGSLIRHDAYFEPDQGVPAKDLIDKLLASASGPATADHPKGQLTVKDISAQLSIRRAESKRDNPIFFLNGLHKFFALSNSSVLYEILGGDVDSLQTILHEERLPAGYETFMRNRNGFTMIEQYFRCAEIAFGIKEVKL